MTTIHIRYEILDDPSRPPYQRPCARQPAAPHWNAGSICREAGRTASQLRDLL